MDLSIIVPCHNLEEHIYRLIESLSIQEISYDVELIFVLDNCVDKTRAMIEAAYPWLDQYQVSIYECEFNAPGLTRNYGFERSTGELIWFVDGDDWIIEKGAVENLIIKTRVLDVDLLQFEYEAPSFSGHGHYSMVWQYIFRRSLIENRRFSELKRNEDEVFMRNLLRIRPRKEKIHNIYYHYNYMREGSTVWNAKHGID